MDVYHPRFATLPGVGRAADGMLLFRQSVATVSRLRADFPFDLIDAHYAFPDGAAAVRLGRHFGVPVCVTLRGGDIDLLPRFRLRRRMIQRTLQQAHRVFAVSEHLARGAAALGLPRERVRVIANGVDSAKFFPMDRGVARQQLGIPPQRHLLLCVGNLLAEKGQHVLIEALGRLGSLNGEAPHLTIIGSNQWGRHDYTRQLERRIQELGLADCVSMIGSQPQDLLATWYSAADLLVLPTFREGCPNVVREALACGTPVVASNVGGVPEVITSDAVGLLVEAGNVAALTDGVRAALQRCWDREAITAIGGRRSWRVVAATVAEEFQKLARNGVRLAG